MFDWYFEQLPGGAKEPKTIKVEHIHEGHILCILGKNRQLPAITGEDLQGYINQRANEDHHGRPIQSETIEKETKTLQMVWNRAVRMGKIQARAPMDVGALRR